MRSQPAFLKIAESLKTAKVQVNAVAKILQGISRKGQPAGDRRPPCAKKASLDDSEELEQSDEEFEDSDCSESESEAVNDQDDGAVTPVDYTNQREILVERSILNPKAVDFLSGVPTTILQEIMTKMTVIQSAKLNAIVRAAPMGVLPILGAAGCGKSTLVALLILLLISSGHRGRSVLLQMWPQPISSSEHLRRTSTRVWSSQLEEDTILRKSSSLAKNSVRRNSSSQRIL
jgi:ABC-type glutathione transport system ATPase component